MTGRGRTGGCAGFPGAGALAVPLIGLRSVRSPDRGRRERPHRAVRRRRQEWHVHRAGPIRAGDLAAAGREDGEGRHRGQPDQERDHQHVAPGRAGEAEVLAVHPVQALAQHLEWRLVAIVVGQAWHARIPPGEKIDSDQFRSLGMNDGRQIRLRRSRAIRTKVRVQKLLNRANTVDDTSTGSLFVIYAACNAAHSLCQDGGDGIAAVAFRRPSGVTACRPGDLPEIAARQPHPGQARLPVVSRVAGRHPPRA